MLSYISYSDINVKFIMKFGLLATVGDENGVM